ncbi:MAG: hypothetical protein ACKOA8_07270 [Deltaproteobacteria bacterium]
MTIFKEWFVILILVELSARVLLGSEPFTFSLEPSTIQPGHHAVLKLRVPLDPSEDESTTTVNDSYLFNSPDLYVLEKSSERTDCCLELKYDLTGYKNQTYSLSPIEIKTRSNSFSTEKTFFTVQTLRGQDDNELREVFDTLPLPLRYKKWIERILLALAAWGLVRYFILKYRKRPKKHRTQAVTHPSPPPEDPRVWLKNQLRILKSKLEEDPTNEFLIDEWGRIIRGYVGRLNSSPALAWTTLELKKLISEQSPILKLIPCFESSDRFRFQNPVKDQNSIPSLVNHFITETENHIILCGI